MVTTRLLLVSVSALLLAAPAFAASEATVGVKIAELRIKPDDQAFSRLKLPGGRPVALLGKSDDGRWVKVRTEIEKGEDVIKLEGWLEVAQLKNADVGGLSVASGGSTGSSSSSGFGESSAPASSGSEWGDTASTPAASSTESWDSTPAAAPAEPAADSMGSWDLGSSDSGSSDSGSSEPAATPAPAGGDEWESTDDSSSSSDSSVDGW